MPHSLLGRSAPTAGAALLLAALLLAVACAPSDAAVRAPSAAAALRSLVGQTSALPRTSVSRARRARLLVLARRARRVSRRSPCRAVRDLASYRRTLKSTRPRARLRRAQRGRALARLARLNASSTVASRSLLRSRRTRRCGGGVAPSTLSETRATLLRSDESGMKLRVRLPQLQFNAASGGGRTFTRLAAPGTQSPGAAGTPGIPVASEVFGVPDGASVQVTASNVKAQTIDGVEVFPVQPEPVDQAPGQTPAPNFFGGPFTVGEFTINAGAYVRRGFSPGPSGRTLGQLRDIEIGALRVPLAQYDAARDRLRVISSVDVEIDFVGGSKSFSDAPGSPWESAQYRLTGGLLNRAVVRRFDREIVLAPCGEELLVITNPTTRTAADAYANARRAAGLRTTVRETGAASGQIGTTAAQIQTFIRGRVNHPSCIRPSYVTIVGDDELVPTFTSTPSEIPSDNPYSTKNDADELPDVAVGRILGNDLAQLDAQIAKIVGYETTPPTGPMLARATLAAQFQDTDGEGQVNDGQENRTFIQFAERARSGLVKRAVAVDRIYDDNPATNPQRFVDGTSLPSSLKKPTFAWDGDGADVSAAWNEGRFMVVHRDHGWSDGWGDPLFTTNEVDALTNTNDNLPVVLSINCASAAYDVDETSFTQNALVRPTGGAVGVFGDTRNSPSWHNSEIALGFLDALLPSILAGEGPATKQRTGDALTHGKLRLAGLAPPSGPGIAGGDGNTRRELYLWHYFGDPTMQMWGGGRRPIVLDPKAIAAQYRKLAPPNPGDPPPYLVEILGPASLAGQPFSLLRNGQVVGKGFAGADGKAIVPALFNDGEPKPGELTVAFEGDDVAPVQVGVDGVPAPPPAPTTLTQSCPGPNEFTAFNLQGPTTVTMTGTLAGAPAGSPVAVTFRHPDRGRAAPVPGPTETVTTTTGPGGSWTASVVTSDRQDIGTWQVSSSFVGTASHAASAAPACPLRVVDAS